MTGRLPVRSLHSAEGGDFDIEEEFNLFLYAGIVANPPNEKLISSEKVRVFSMKVFYSSEREEFFVYRFCHVARSTSQNPRNAAIQPRTIKGRRGSWFKE
ncbi:MAG TPA: hypothetical protein DEB70_04040 [Planctomycetaceae bacterium]|nr:hypothetical protein [Planctomycetaceae bacterium]|tara:strand:+ start:119 stop:418 length:300 start_codon:yes stop_codon:yes gene_type:complete